MGQLRAAGARADRERVKAAWQRKLEGMTIDEARGFLEPMKRTLHVVRSPQCPLNLDVHRVVVHADENDRVVAVLRCG